LIMGFGYYPKEDSCDVLSGPWIFLHVMRL
jgi:hypothetical protein